VRIEFLDGCGHVPAEKCPQMVAEHLRGFLASAAAGGRSATTLPPLQSPAAPCGRLLCENEKGRDVDRGQGARGSAASATD
jgi:hypothetical protein